MLDRVQWFVAGMSITLLVQLSQPVAAAVPASKTVQTAQSNSSGAADKLYKENLFSFFVFNGGLGFFR